MIAPRQEGPFFDDRYERDDGYQAAYRPLEKMNPRPAGPMPASRHHQARIGSCRTRKYRATQARTALICGGMTQRRRKKILETPVVIANS